MDYLYDVMVTKKLFNELILVMRGEVAVEFAHSGAFVLGQNGKSVDYLDSWNDDIYHYPKAFAGGLGQQLKPEEVFGEYYFEWTLYKIQRRRLRVKEAKRIENRLTYVMTGDESYVPEKFK